MARYIGPVCRLCRREADAACVLFGTDGPFVSGRRDGSLQCLNLGDVPCKSRARVEPVLSAVLSDAMLGLVTSEG